MATKSDQEPMLTLLHINMVLYALCFGLVVPTLPYIVGSMVESPYETVVYGYLQTTYSVLQLIGAPVVGVIGDKYGTKYALIVSFGSSAINYFLLGSASTIEMVFLSRIPALLQHALLASHSCIYFRHNTRTREVKENRKGIFISQLSLSFGIGVVIGPAIGGVISNMFSYSAVAYLASLISAINMALLFIFMADSPNRPKRANQSSGFSLALMYQIFNNRTVLALLVLRVIASIPSAFLLDAQKNGFVMSYVGVMMAIAQGFVVGHVSSRYKDHVIMFYATICMAVFSFALLFVTNILEFMLFLGPLICSGAVLNTVISATLTKSVDITEILGVDMSLSSASRVMAPTIGSYLYFAFVAATWTKFNIFPFASVK